MFSVQDRALLVIKLKKHKEKEYSNVDGQLLNVLQMVGFVCAFPLLFNL